MKRNLKLIIILIILILIALLCYYKNHKPQEINNTISEIKEIKVIDKYDKIKEIHENPEKEKCVLVDVIIDGKYYTNCGIRTKGDAIYEAIKKNHIDSYSYKLELDFMNPEQNYNGITELHLNSSMHDATRNKRILGL